MSRITMKANTNVSASTIARSMYGIPEVSHLRDHAPSYGASEHYDTLDYLPFGKDRLQLPFFSKVSTECQRIDQPGLDRSEKNVKPSPRNAEASAQAQKGADTRHIKR